MFLHRELERFPAGDLEALVSDGLLRETSRTTEVPRPAHLPGRGDLLVRQTSRGLFGVADEDDYFDPIPLTEADVRQYELSVPKLVTRIRRENAISGAGFERRDGLISLGQKTINGLGTVDVYLSIPNEDEVVLVSRCWRLAAPARPQRTVLMTPQGASLSAEGRRDIDSASVIVLSMADAAANGSCAVDWSDRDLIAALGARRPATLASLGRKGGRPALSRERARRLLLDAVTRFRKDRDPTEPLTNAGLARATGRNEETIGDRLRRADWTLDDLDVEWTRQSRKKPE